MKMFACTLLSLAFGSVTRAQSPSVFIEDLTWIEVRDAIAAGHTTALYLAGSVEEGGPHMVLGKHNILARYVALRIAEELGDALVYPTMPFAPTGDPVLKDDLMAFPGSISVTDETFGAVAREVALSAIAAGFRNVILMGEHGGGWTALKNVAASLEASWAPKGIHVYFADGGPYDEEVNRYLKAHGMPVGQHAHIPDTSKLLFLDREARWVRKDKIAPGGVWETTGVDGDPTYSSAELGRLFLDHEVRLWVNQIRLLVLPAR